MKPDCSPPAPPDPSLPAPPDPVDPILDPILAPILRLPGIGHALGTRLENLIRGKRICDLLFHLPDSHLDRGPCQPIAAAIPGQIATIRATVLRHDAPAQPRQPWRVTVGDGSGFAELTFFGRPGQTPPQLDLLPREAQILVSGKCAAFGGRLCFAHPDWVLPAAREAELPRIEPVWRLSAGIGAGRLRRLLTLALSRLPSLPEWLDPALVRRENWPGFAEALQSLHAPRLMPDQAPRLRLAYDELFARQLAYALLRRQRRLAPGRPISAGTDAYRRAALARFGHRMTEDQARTLAEIDADLAAPHRMLRLLHGDVGSGKTLVALLAMLRAAEAGHQAALMAPTEILARQHLRTFRRLAPIEVELLTGSLKTAERRRILGGLGEGGLKLVIGTHALFQSGVRFQDLALAVIDEQHRFGVDQRLLLAAKGERTDLLVMTATPIPRSLLLTHWGEMDISRLTAKPAGRAPVRTTLHALSALPEITRALARALDQDERIFWVCPLVSESDASDLAAAEARFADFQLHFGARVGLVHGRQNPAEREARLAAFASGRTKLLIATTVIEVGVDVPEANIMVIDHADRFGLAQLHQLRGRIGRGQAGGFCLLLHDDALSAAARARLVLLRDTDDGFAIADADFRLRGPGELLGTQQSGAISYRLGHAEQQSRLLEIAGQDAAYLLSVDPSLQSPRGIAARLLLRLFGREDASLLLTSG